MIRRDFLSLVFKPEGHDAGDRCLSPFPVIQVNAITVRRDPIYVDVFNASSERLAIGGLSRMGFLLKGWSGVRDWSEAPYEMQSLHKKKRDRPLKGLASEG